MRCPLRSRYWLRCLWRGRTDAILFDRIRLSQPFTPDTSSVHERMTPVFFTTAFCLACDRHSDTADLCCCFSACVRRSCWIVVLLPRIGLKSIGYGHPKHFTSFTPSTPAWSLLFLLLVHTHLSIASHSRPFSAVVLVLQGTACVLVSLKDHPVRMSFGGGRAVVVDVVAFSKHSMA
jgi:hypothetical protein